MGGPGSARKALSFHRITGRPEGCRVLLAAIVFMLIPLTGAYSQWITQTIQLNPGWNAVFVEIEPGPNECESVFEGIPIGSVWYWAPDTSTVQYVTNPDDLIPESPDWKVYFPNTSLARTLSTLRIIRGNRPYLIKLNSDTPVNLTISGSPSTRKYEWIQDSYNLTGFNISDSVSTTFDKLLSSSAAHTGQPVYHLVAGAWQLVADTAAESPAPGEAFWVYTAGASQYQGAVSAGLTISSGLDFGRGVQEHTVTLNNETAAEKTMIVEMIASETPADPESAALAGPVPLSYWKTGYDTGDVGWEKLEEPVTFVTPAHDSAPLRLAVRRKDMASPPAVKGDLLYQSILKIWDSDGLVIEIPVMALGFVESGEKAGDHPYAGLWAGKVVLDGVSQPADAGDPATPRATGSEFAFRVLVHVDSTGTPRFLQQVTQMWKPPVMVADPDFPDMMIIDTPGEFVLITEEDRLADFEGTALRGGIPVGRRISTPAFGFREPIVMEGVFPAPRNLAASITCSVVLDYQDPLNPFKHRYHPDHNNLDEYYEDTLAEGKESFTVTRKVTFDFLDYDPAAEGEGEGEEARKVKEEGELLTSAYAGYGDGWLGGTYRETVTGVHRDPIHVEGKFKLNFVCDAAELNPEN